MEPAQSCSGGSSASKDFRPLELRNRPGSNRGGFFLVCRACLTTRRCKSSSQRDGREVIAKRKGEITLAAKRGLKPGEERRGSTEAKEVSRIQLHQRTRT